MRTGLQSPRRFKFQRGDYAERRQRAVALVQITTQGSVLDFNRPGGVGQAAAVGSDLIDLVTLRPAEPSRKDAEPELAPSGRVAAAIRGGARTMREIAQRAGLRSDQPDFVINCFGEDGLSGRVRDALGTERLEVVPR